MQFFAALVVKTDAPFRALHLAAQLLRLLAERVDLGLDAVISLASLAGLNLCGLQTCLELLKLLGHHAHMVFRLVLFSAELHVVLVGKMSVEHPHIIEQGLITPGLGGLTLQRAHLAFHFRNDIGDAQQVGFRVFKFAQSLLFLTFEFRDTGSFFEHHSAIFRLGTQEHVNLALRHDRVGLTANACARKQIIDVLQAADRAIEAVLAAAITEDAAADGDFVVVHSQRSFTVGHG